MDFSFFRVGYLMSLQKRLWNSLSTSTGFDDSDGCPQGNHVADADVYRLASLFCRDCRTDNFAFVLQEGNISDSGAFNLAEQPAFCNPYGRSTYHKAEMAGKTATIGMSIALSVNKEKIRLQM